MTIRLASHAVLAQFGRLSGVDVAHQFATAVPWHNITRDVPPAHGRFGVGAAVFVATLVLGIRSYHAREALHCWNGASSQGVVLTKGQILFWRQLLLDNPGSAGPLEIESAWRTPARDMRDYDSPRMTLHSGFGFGSIASRWYPVRQLEAPAWAISLLLGAPPAWWLASLRRRRQQRHLTGLCPACGYDLRASHDCCPECGTRRPSGPDL